jgi:hypothetical protein
MYASGGYSGITLQNISTLNPPVTQPAYGYNYNKPLYLTEFILAAGNARLPSSFRSENNLVGVNYSSAAIKKYTAAGNATWYDYLKTNIAKSSSIAVLASAQINGGSMNGQFMIAPNAFTVRERSGDLTVSSGAVCNIKAILLISGNLTIEPDLRTSGNSNGCIYIVKGNVTIGVGTRKNPANVLANSPTQYDIIEGMFVVDGQFNSSLDVFADGRKGDGLYLKGGLISKSVDLRRDITGFSNTRQPSEVFVYDPRYMAIPELTTILDAKEIALREF